MGAEIIEVDILIAGGGSAGFGAAYQACKSGNGKFTVAVIDSNDILGGTSTSGGVNTWEMGIGGPGVHNELAQRLLDEKNKAAVLKGNWKPLVRNRPYAIASPSPDYKYEDTLKAAGIHDRFNNHNSFIFEPESMAEEMLRMVKEAGGDNFQFYNNEKIAGLKTCDCKISEIHTDKRIFMPKIIIDCTGDVIVARLAGCKTELGINNSKRKINGVTQVYRVTKKAYASIDKVPPEYQSPYSDKTFTNRLDNVKVISSINKYPNGDLNINPLPTMDGDEFFKGDINEMILKCRGRVYLHWRRLQEDSPFMRDYRIKEIYPMIGIRESYRLVGKYVLTADDLIKGFEAQNLREEIIAFSDHPVDIHGGDHPGIRILDRPYGIPYSCMVPNEINNLFTACRGASFDSTAAASCRLSRTMIALGEAAGTAAVQCIDTKTLNFNTDVNKIRHTLKIPAFTETLSYEAVLPFAQA